MTGALKPPVAITLDFVCVFYVVHILSKPTTIIIAHS